jgi:hypothetical protein
MTITTLAIDDSRVGQVLAQNRTLREIRYLRGPDKGRGTVGQFFRLDETGAGFAVPKALWACDMSVAMFVPNTPDSCFSAALVSNAAVKFIELTLGACPAGAKFEVDVD